MRTTRRRKEEKVRVIYVLFQAICNVLKNLRLLRSYQCQTLRSFSNLYLGEKKCCGIEGFNHCRALFSEVKIRERTGKYMYVISSSKSK